MLNELRVRNNENLVRNILKYNNVKDLALTSQVNRTFSKVSDKFQIYWREQMNKTLSSDYEYYNLASAQNLSEDSFCNDYTNWKQLLNNTFEIKKEWFNLTETSKKNKSISYNDVENTKSEIYSSLKEFIKFPSLRKSNLFIESDLNSSLQLYLLDNIFDSQDLYDYFDQYFLQQNEVTPRKNEFPFKEHLQSFNQIIQDFTPMMETILSKIRWYHYEEVLQMNNDSDDILNVILLVIKTIHNFCEFSYSYIKKYKYDNVLFLNEYSKRYRHFVDIAIHINNYLENLNVIINYLYEHFFNIKYNPKFSFFRLFIKMWNKEVLKNIECEEGLICKMRTILSKCINQDLNEISNGNNESDISFKISNNTNKNLIEQCSQHLLDASCNEFNVFYLNSTELHLDEGMYIKWEREVLSIFDEVCEDFLKIPDEKLFNYLRSNDILNVFIQRTRSKIIDMFSTKLMCKIRSVIIGEFKSFINKFLNNESSYLEEHYSQNEGEEENDEKLLEILMNTIILENKKTAKYKALKFIKHCRKNKLAIYHDFLRISDKLGGIKREIDENDKLISKENKKRNIFMTLTKIEDKLYSFTKEFRVEEITKSNASKLCFSEGYKGYSLDLEIYLKSMMTEECLISYRTK